MVNVNIYKAPLKSPFSVCLWIADSCNLSCKYCYAAPFSGKLMDYDRLCQLLDELTNLEVFSLVLAGGEPFMHPRIFDVIKRAVDAGIQVGVLSNGTCLNEKARIKLAKIVSGKKFILQISLDSFDPLINDKTRDKGNRVIENLRALSKLDIQLQIACVLTKYNIDSAHLIIKEFYPAVKRFHFLNVQRTKNSLQYPDILLSESQAYKFWMRLKEYAKEFPSDLFLPSLRIMLRAYDEEELTEEQSFHQKATFACKSCSVGLTHVNIDSDFNVLGCDIAKDFTNMGNVRYNSFNDIWNSYQAYQVRNFSYPPCYKIKNDDDESLQDFLKSEISFL
jgi:MoaA/NifB/PqqE/SkfB family radical SAM enzyme